MQFLFVAERTSRLRTAGKRCIITAIFREDCRAEAKKKVYVETSVVSNLTARRSYNLIDAARQAATQTWWDTMNDHSEVMEELWKVKKELSSGFKSFHEYFEDLLRRQAERFSELSSQHVEGAAAH